MTRPAGLLDPRHRRDNGKTGVEMEALTAVSVAPLTLFDMCKALDRDMVISDVRLSR